MRRLPIHRTITTVDDFLNEFNIAPVLDDTVSVQPKNEMEAIFFDVLMKHHGHELGDERGDYDYDDYGEY